MQLVETLPPVPPGRDQAGTAARGTETNVKALDRGLRVLTVMADADKPCTVSEIAHTIGITRTAARRFILTLEHLGYVKPYGPGYRLQAHVLELGETYLQGQPLFVVSRPYLKELAETVEETVSLTVLHRGFVTYIDRVHALGLLAINVVVGSRVPAYSTATGRVLLGQLEEDDLEDYVSGLQRLNYAVNTETDITALRTTVLAARSQGWFLADQELTPGLRSLAVPIKGDRERLPAAISIAASASRVSERNLQTNYLQPLRTTAERISRNLAEEDHAGQPFRS